MTNDFAALSRTRPFWRTSRLSYAQMQSVLKADIRPGVTGALTAKVEHVERRLAEQ